MTNEKYAANDSCPVVFSTERLPLAIFLHASQKLRFIGCESSGAGKLKFLFEDAEHSGPRFELDFDRGAVVPATELFASQKYIRRAMTGALDEYRKNGETPHDRHPRN
jgi:hypothetical protein